MSEQIVNEEEKGKPTAQQQLESTYRITVKKKKKINGLSHFPNKDTEWS